MLMVAWASVVGTLIYTVLTSARGIPCHQPQPDTSCISLHASQIRRPKTRAPKDRSQK